MATRLFGIRHHGAGSARSLLQALKGWKPDVVLIEGAPEAEVLLRNLDLFEKLKPPVAMLLYNPGNLSQAVYLPFAGFSPEWVAIKWAMKEEVPVRFMDLPQAFHFGMEIKQEEREAARSDNGENPTEQLEKQRKLRRDPISFLADVAGYEDSERWWEVMVEQREESEEIFTAIEEMMGFLRGDTSLDGLKMPERSRDLLREAYMRKVLRKAEKDFVKPSLLEEEEEGKIAVVCGAWHVPALANRPSAKEDNALLKGLPKAPVKAAWVPWTYERLAFSSGYGAGLISPAWYEMLFSSRKNAVIRWFVKAARLLREEDLDASSAHVIEAVRMAEALAALRGLSIPGLPEMMESAVCILGGGYEEPLALVRENLVVGKKMGKIPEEADMIPLQKDIMLLRKSLRLKQDEIDDLKLDLRDEFHRRKSEFIYRLNLLGINWGTKRKGRIQGQGTFWEFWKLAWKAGFVMRIIQAGAWGNTVQEASENHVRRKAAKAAQLDEISQLLEEALQANLSLAIPAVVQRLTDLASLSRDVPHLMGAIPPLVQILLYGNVRQTEGELVGHVVDQILPRIFAGLPAASQSIADEAAEALGQQVTVLNISLRSLGQEDFLQDWNASMRVIAESEQAHGFISGLCSRILFDTEVIGLEEASGLMGRALSRAGDVQAEARWLRGFLEGNALLILNNPDLWEILNQWVSGIGEDHFKDMLPVLRRTFANFSVPERQKIMRLVDSGGKKQKAATMEVDPERAALVLPVLQQLLGLNPHKNKN